MHTCTNCFVAVTLNYIDLGTQRPYKSRNTRLGIDIFLNVLQHIIFHCHNYIKLNSCVFLIIGILTPFPIQTIDRLKREIII